MKKQKHDFQVVSRSMCNKTIIIIIIIIIEVCPSNYILLDQPRAGHRRGGGTAFMYRESLFQVSTSADNLYLDFDYSGYHKNFI